MNRWWGSKSDSDKQSAERDQRAAGRKKTRRSGRPPHSDLALGTLLRADGAITLRVPWLQSAIAVWSGWMGAGVGGGMAHKIWYPQSAVEEHIEVRKRALTGAINGTQTAIWN